MDNIVSIQQWRTVGLNGPLTTPDGTDAQSHWMRPDSPVRSGDYQYLLDKLSDRSPGSKRNVRSKGGYLITRGESSDSVLNSGPVDPHDQELKLLRKLNSGEYSMEQIDEYRKSLVQSKIEGYHRQSKKGKVLKKQKSSGGVKIGGKYRQHSQLDLVMAELAHSPLNGAENLPSDHIKMSESLRRLRFDPSAPPLDITFQDEHKDGDAPESKSPKAECEREKKGEEPNKFVQFTDRTELDRSGSDKKNKYSLQNKKSSPFFDPSTGKPVPAKKVVPKEKDFAARHLNQSKVPQATRRKVKSANAWMPRVPANWNSGDDDIKDSEQSLEHSASAKLPTRLRETCSKQFQTIVQFKQKNKSEMSWKNIKRKHARDRRLLLEEDAKHRQHDPLLESGDYVDTLDRDRITCSQDSVEVSGGAGSMLGFDMAGLMTLDELEELSHDSGTDDHHLRDGSAAGLFGTESLEHLAIDSTDFMLISDLTTPEDVLAGCLGKLLFSDTSTVKVRPASAGIGGVSKGRISSPSRGLGRPRTANPDFAQSGIAKEYKGDPTGTKKRPVICRARPPEDWFS